MSAAREPKPFFRKSKNSWYLQIGSRQISLGKDKKAAFAKYHQIMASNEPLSESTTVELLFERYLDWVKEHRKPGTYDKIRHHLSSFARYIGKSRKIATLSGSDLSLWVEGQTQWGSTMSNEAIVSVIRCFNWAVGKKYIASNNVSNVPDKPRRKRREVTFSNEEWLEIKRHVRDKAFSDFLDFMWETGCRPIEARIMEACHVDVERGLVVFPESQAKGERHERVIYLTEKAKDICRPLVAKHPTGPILLNTRGMPWKKNSLNCRFARLKKKLGKRVFAYAIRHSYATQGLVDGVDSVTLSQLMGHTDVSTLAKNYAHLSRRQDYLKQQAAKVRPET